MPTAKRDSVLKEFAAVDRGLISNARCLTEGVDTPEVDMVAFLSPKKSLIDVAQAVGRCSRTSPETGKEHGYVLIPLFVEQAAGETVEDAFAPRLF